MKTQSRAESRSSKSRGPQVRSSSSAVVRRLRRIVTKNGKFPYGSATRCLDVVEHVFSVHRRMCNNLQAVVQEYHLGLGGEPIDEIVCAELKRLLPPNGKAETRAP